MSIPSELQALVNRLDRELDSIEKDATEGLNLVRQMLSLFPDNTILTQYFASFSSILLFVETYKRRVEATVNSLSTEVLPLRRFRR